MDLYYQKSGSAQNPPLLILHGLFGSLKNWNGIGRKLSQSFHVFNLDLRNHGNSPHSDEMNYSVMAEDIKTFIEQQQLQKVNIIGHSMGGKTAMYTALRYPQMIDKMAVIDIAPVTYKHRFETILNALQSLPLSLIKSRQQAQKYLQTYIDELSIVQFLLLSLKIDTSGKTAAKWLFNLPVIQQSMEYISAFPESGMPAPVQSLNNELFLKAEFSNYINENNRNRIKYFFPGSKIVTVKNSSHWMHAEQTDLLIQILTNFFHR